MSSSHIPPLIPLPTIERYPVSARHIEPSALLSMDDEPTQPSTRLVELLCAAASLAHTLSLSALSERIAQPPYWVDVWPGEHYRLLAALTRILKPSTVIEIGTDTGLSALAIMSELAADARLITFDIIPWQQIPQTVLRDEDFSDGRLQQSTDDLTETHKAQLWASKLSQADMIFVDAAKDGVMEYEFLHLFKGLPLRPGTIVVFDDIRLWNMLGVWRSITHAKIDATSFGHWSGTGLVEW